MKYITALILLLKCLTSEAQLGNGYDYVLNDIKANNKEYKLITDANDKVGYCLISFESPEGPILAVYHYFKYEDNVCYMVAFAYPLDNINTMIQLMDEKYVKQSELHWKDYKTNVYYEVSKDKDFAYLRKY